MPERLYPSPNFNLCRTLDGRPYVAKDVEPYTQYWLTERYRTLLGLFGARQGATVQAATLAYLRLTGAKDTSAERQRLQRAITDMRQAGVLVSSAEDTSRYHAAMVADYLEHRPFPAHITQAIIECTGLGPESTVLDLAGGPGDLALQLAKVSAHVSLMELSKGFLAAARHHAEQRSLPLTTLHESCNRLAMRDDRYDVITVAQALHWLDDVQVCRGVCRMLQPGGSFVVVQGSMDIADTHPLAYLLGRHSILGAKQTLPFAEQILALQKRLGLLFEALDAPTVHRIDPAQRWGNDSAAAQQRILPTGVTLFRQHRPFGVGFAKAFLTPQHIAATGQAPQDFWREVAQRCASATATDLLGHADWAMLHFQRREGAARWLNPLDPEAIQPQSIDSRDMPC